ncbi:MAG TPA: nitroreductase family protein [Nitrososphaeraceae archaeon]|jgi:nitroreductase|nr:nitroreductase family protein [Nitrososphaeraceae archaeon]
MSNPTDILNKLFKETKPQDRLYPIPETPIQDFDSEDILNTNIYNVMLNRRSQRKFEIKEVEDWKLDIIFAAADTAPTAGGFQGFEIFHIKNPDIKIKLVVAANNQPYVNAPVVLVFCMNPRRVKMQFSSEILRKFSIQDATLAAAYAQLAAHSLGLSSIWIGMIDDRKVMETIGTDLLPSSILCIGYPKKVLQPKPKRALSELIHTIE